MDLGLSDTMRGALYKDGFFCRRTITPVWIARLQHLCDDPSAVVPEDGASAVNLFTSTTPLTVFPDIWCYLQPNWEPKNVAELENLFSMFDRTECGIVGVTLRIACSSAQNFTPRWLLQPISDHIVARWREYSSLVAF
jgi:hypothetical protein